MKIKFYSKRIATSLDDTHVSDRKDRIKNLQYARTIWYNHLQSRVIDKLKKIT